MIDKRELDMTLKWVRALVWINAANEMAHVGFELDFKGEELIALADAHP